MELKAFDLIVDKLTPALLAQEFSAPEDYEVENGKAKCLWPGTWHTVCSTMQKPSALS